MFKRFRSISGDIQSTRHLAADHLPCATKALPSQKLVYYSNIKKIPLHIIILLCTFAFIGLMNMYSISLTKSPIYFQKFLIFWVISIVPLVIIPIINLRYFIKFSYIVYIASVLLLVAVLLAGDTSMGARRWIDIGFRFQPSELAKVAVILVVARHYHFMKTFSMYNLVHIGVVCVCMAIPSALIILQPDLGSALIIVFITCIMIFANGIKWRWIILMIVGFALTVPIVWKNLHGYQKNRILTFMNPERDPYGAGYNVIQSKIAIGSGGLFGKGYTKNDQSSLKFLPENQTDFAFTVFAEEFGFVGSVVLLLLFLYLILYGMLVSQRSESYFGKMFALGITSLLFLHICINLMMIMGLLPVVGIPLPFISYGGSSLLLCVSCVAVLMNIDINRNIVIQSSVSTYMLK
ncbi:MAG: rod shape determining protein RodA [Candidatus Deianiraeaceae bacterium]|jgi:rod shape determining protein RodA